MAWVKGIHGSPYGRKGSLWAAGYHTGHDVLCPVGTPVRYPWTYGKVIEVGNVTWGPAYGIAVIVQTVSGTRYMVAHLSKTSVKVGQRVTRGTLLGLSGNTGNSTGPHCHIEARKKPFRYAVDSYPPKGIY